MKSKIYDMVVEFTKNNLDLNANSVYISSKLNLSRNLVSQYLNELFNEHKLIKINTRPVIFYDIEQIEKLNNTELETFEFKSMDDLKKALVSKEKKDFENLIGYNESLSTVVNQCKAAMSYPPDGLPVLLNGPTGTGKSFMAQLMYEYGINHGLIDRNKKFLTVNCSEYANNPELLVSNLFGHKKGAYTGADKDNPGLIKLAEGGVLFLDEVHCLKASSQEKLFLFMDKGIYHMVGDNEQWYQSNVRLIFATTENPGEALLKTLLRRIPIIVRIPSLDERGIHERIELIYSILKKEEKRVNRNILISNVVYNTLLTTSFAGNIGDLKNCIQVSCANSFIRSTKDDGELKIHAYDLPEDIMNQPGIKKNIISSDNQSAMISLFELKNYSDNKHEQVKLNNEIIEYFAMLADNKIDNHYFVEKCFAAINKYYDYIIFKNRTSELDFIQGIIQDIFDIISSRYGFKISNNDIIAISSYINDYSRYNYELSSYYDSHTKEAKELSEYICRHFNREYLIAVEMSKNIKANMDIDLNAIGISIMALNLKRINKIVDINKCIGVIIAHGYSTASSIADSANKLLGQYVFDAMDMPLNVNTQTIVDNLNSYLSRRGNYKELVLLVDMGSLEEIHEGIVLPKNCSVGIMNNITTKLALEIGNEIINNVPLEKIFKKVKENCEIRYKIINNHLKEKVILCSCASGIGTAEKLKQILLDSAPKKLPLKVLSYDYSSLIEKKLNDTFFDNYDILCIIGTLDPEIEGVKFVPLENLLIGDTFNELDEYSSQYISEKEISDFKRNILKNFSLSNIINNLTILNPNKLLEHVEKALDKLQELLNVKLSNNTCYCLYVHICCMIERLVIGKSTEEYTMDINGIDEQKIAFVNTVKTAFSVVEKYYRVEIPIEEIGYIYEYIRNN